MPTVAFVGVDLAWHSAGHSSGLAVLTLDGCTCSLASRTSLTDLTAVVDYVDRHGGGTAVVAVDAPLIVTNPSGQRPCETEIGRRFGRFQASAHSTNLTLFPNPRGVQLSFLLTQKGFTQAPRPSDARGRPGRWFFEVYPHPAQVVLFDLNRTLKYKKGRVEDRRLALVDYRSRLDDLLSRSGVSANPLLEEVLNLEVADLGGRGLKRYEDELDAVFCAALARRFWLTGSDGFEMIGDLEAGYIVNPVSPPPLLTPA